jgi:hypothetical protein
MCYHYRYNTVIDWWITWITSISVFKAEYRWQFYNDFENQPGTVPRILHVKASIDVLICIVYWCDIIFYTFKMDGLHLFQRT